MSDDTTDTPKRRPRGFETLPPERRHEIASKGGISAHAKGTAHEFTSEEAKAAGRKGGRRRAAKVAAVKAAAKP